VRRFRRRLLVWGDQHRRDLPWRRTRDPWRILVSEVMLQQTQVARVVPHYERFVGTFPTPSACARTGPAEVVRLWSGLGYNRRALNLHRTARIVVAEHAGTLPTGDAALRALPGIGAYTARAVRAFAFGEDVATVDTNAVRVLARCVAGSPLSVRSAMELGDRLVPKGRSWEFNQTIFDLGATICAAMPICARCPLRRQCTWRADVAEDPSHAPDPWRTSTTARPQSAFAGSDRQGRGRLLDALREGAVGRPGLAEACGWPGDPARAERIASALVDEGFARWAGRAERALRLR
jgi:A/G-specific adenine glycosylase